MNKIVNDQIAMNDKISRPGLWAKTQVIFGHGLHTNANGMSELDEVIFETTNMVPLIGVQFAMEMIFGINGADGEHGNIKIPRPVVEGKVLGANDIKGTDGLPYPYGQCVCLFGIGSGGASDNNLTANEVFYNETNVSNMIPFRYFASNADNLTADEKRMYFGKASSNNGTYTGYYLKRFDQDPIIYHKRKNNINENEDGSDVDESIFTNGASLAAGTIESFTECHLTITQADVREYFAARGNTEVPRINSLALYSAAKGANETDYSNIQLFSKLNIPTEVLTLTKDMNIIYRVYGA